MSVCNVCLSSACAVPLTSLSSLYHVCQITILCLLLNAILSDLSPAPAPHGILTNANLVVQPPASRCDLRQTSKHCAVRPPTETGEDCGWRTFHHSFRRLTFTFHLPSIDANVHLAAGCWLLAAPCEDSSFIASSASLRRELPFLSVFQYVSSLLSLYSKD